MLKTSDFSYNLPQELIAQFPPAERDASRLLCLDRATGAISHSLFSNLDRLLRPGDLLVLNDTRVVPARVFCTKQNGVKIELLFTRRIDAQTWTVIAKPARRLTVGTTITLDADPTFKFRVVESRPDGSRVMHLESDDTSLDTILERFGRIPLPHYMNRDDIPADRERYQTVFARNAGAIAAPTAGLHFTPELFDRLASSGIQRVFVTLHVGIGTFRPVSVENPAEHKMHAEWFEIPAVTAATIAETRAKGGRVIAAGTTVVRTLEHAASLNNGTVSPMSGESSMFILPGYQFKIIDGLITNFHLPESTLLMLVSAFAGRDHVLAAYAQAIKERYRFFSYGDAMFIA